MTFLPIVERELRTAARRPGTYRMRVAAALGAILVGAVILVATLGGAPQQAGRYTFMGLSGLALLYALGAGRRWTADSLSQEKRDGTLGLLFLTDLKGHDVVLGKLAATSLGGFYALLGLVPILAIPLLLGGVTNFEFWRAVLVLVNTFLFSLAVGLCGSALSRDVRRAMAANLSLLLLLTVGPPAIAAAAAYLAPPPGPTRFNPVFFFSCPVYSYVLCTDANYKAAPIFFWLSVAVIHGLTWLLVVVASVIAPRSWQDRPDRERTRKPGFRERWRTFWRRWSFGRAEGQIRFRHDALEINPFFWLAGRARLKPIHVWTFMACMAAWWLVGWLTTGHLWFDAAVAVLTALLLNATLKSWAAIEAGQQLGEERKAGTLELLLSTPLSIQEILRGQWLALRRQFLKPLVVVIAIELFFMVQSLGRGYKPEVLCLWLAGIFMLVTDIWAIIWVAMWQSLTAKNQHQAMLKTFIQILFLPWLFVLAISGIVNLWVALSPGPGERPDWKFNLALWCGLGLAADLYFGLLAWWRLRHYFRQAAMPQFVEAGRFRPKRQPPALAQPSRLAWWRRPPKLPKAAPGLSPALPTGLDRPSVASAHASVTSSAPGQPASSRRWLGTRRKRVAFGAALTALLVTTGLLLVIRGSSPKFPPPLTVHLSSDKGPLRVYPSNLGALLILPDGSLWRWGRSGVAGLPPLVLPERIGTNSDWVQAADMNSHSVGLRRDGTLWEWHVTRGNIPQQVGEGHDWVAVAAGSIHAVALRRDGTLWTWGNNGLGQLGIGPGQVVTSLVQVVQVGTNSDWTAVTCQWGSTFALRADGTLWAWGRLNVFRGGSGGVTSVYTPTMVCDDTNWTALVPGWTPQAWTRNGDLWELFNGYPNPNAPAVAVGQVLITNAVPGRVAIAYTGQPKIYQIHPDGTLWERNCPLSPWTSVPSSDWRRVGKRSDWVSLWGSGTVAFGLTRDGTLWTWGLDPTGISSPGFLTTLKAIQAQVRARLAAPTARFGSGGGMPGHQKEPHPLLRLEPD